MDSITLSSHVAEEVSLLSGVSFMRMLYYLSVALTEYPNKKQLGKSYVLSFSSRGDAVHCGAEGMRTDSESIRKDRNVPSHTFLHLCTGSKDRARTRIAQL